jgi:hypothetical protein
MAARWAAISIVVTPVCPGDRLGKSGNLAGTPHTAAASDSRKASDSPKAGDSREFRDS